MICKLIPYILGKIVIDIDEGGADSYVKIGNQEIFFPFLRLSHLWRKMNVCLDIIDQYIASPMMWQKSKFSVFFSRKFRAKKKSCEHHCWHDS